MQALHMDTDAHTQMDRPKPICRLNVFEVGGIIISDLKGQETLSGKVAVYLELLQKLP